MSQDHSARTALRAATAEYHDRVDRVFSQMRLDDRASYGDFLTAQAAAHIPVERALSVGGVAGIVPDWAMRQRSDLLCDDLAHLGLSPPEPAGLLSLDSEAAVLGALYVLEGSRLGGSVLKRAVPAQFPTRFLGGVDSAAWRSLLALLDVRLEGAVERSVAVTAACDVFVLFEISGQRHGRNGHLG